jgi:hypothetical protein
MVTDLHKIWIVINLMCDKRNLVRKYSHRNKFEKNEIGLHLNITVGIDSKLLHMKAEHLMIN